MKLRIASLVLLSLAVACPVIAGTLPPANRSVLRQEAKFRSVKRVIKASVPVGIATHDQQAVGQDLGLRIRVSVDGVPVDSSDVDHEGITPGNCDCPTKTCGGPTSHILCKEDLGGDNCWCTFVVDPWFDLGPVPIGKAVYFELIEAPGSFGEQYTADDTATVLVSAPLVPGTSPIPGTLTAVLLLLAGSTVILIGARAGATRA